MRVYRRLPIEGGGVVRAQKRIGAGGDGDVLEAQRAIRRRVEFGVDHQRGGA